MDQLSHYTYMVGNQRQWNPECVKYPKIIPNVYEVDDKHVTVFYIMDIKLKDVFIDPHSMMYIKLFGLGSLLYTKHGCEMTTCSCCNHYTNCNVLKFTTVSVYLCFYCYNKFGKDFIFQPNRHCEDKTERVRVFKHLDVIIALSKNEARQCYSIKHDLEHFTFNKLIKIPWFMIPANNSCIWCNKNQYFNGSCKECYDYSCNRLWLKVLIFQHVEIIQDVINMICNILLKLDDIVMTKVKKNDVVNKIVEVKVIREIKEIDEGLITEDNVNEYTELYFNSQDSDVSEDSCELGYFY